MSDKRLRELERLAKAGDEHAAEALQRGRCRLGEHNLGAASFDTSIGFSLDGRLESVDMVGKPWRGLAFIGELLQLHSPMA